MPPGPIMPWPPMPPGPRPIMPWPPMPPGPRPIMPWPPIMPPMPEPLSLLSWLSRSFCLLLIAACFSRMTRTRKVLSLVSMKTLPSIAPRISTAVSSVGVNTAGGRRLVSSMEVGTNQGESMANFSASTLSVRTSRLVSAGGFSASGGGTLRSMRPLASLARRSTSPALVEALPLVRAF